MGSGSEHSTQAHVETRNDTTDNKRGEEEEKLLEVFSLLYGAM